MVDGVLSGHDRGTGRGGAWLGIGGGKDQTLISDGVNIRSWVAYRDATAVAAHVAREELALPVTLEAQALRQWLNARRVMPMTCVIDRESVLRELIPGEMADADVQGLLRWARG